MENKMKKLITPIVIGISFVAGIMIYGQVVKYFNFDNNFSFQVMADEADEFMTQEEYNLEKAFLEATTPEEKQKSYETLMDYYVRTGELTQEEGQSLKQAGYDDNSDYYFAGDSLSDLEDVMLELDYMLKEGYITQEEYDLEKAILSSETHEEKQKAFEALIDYCVSEGHLTEEEGKEEKAAGYKEYFDYTYGV